MLWVVRFPSEGVNIDGKRGYMNIHAADAVVTRTVMKRRRKNARFFRSAMMMLLKS